MRLQRDATAVTLGWTGMMMQHVVTTIRIDRGPVAKTEVCTRCVWFREYFPTSFIV